QIVLDSKHILILGGCGGPNMLLTDVWLLTIPDDPNADWEWKLIHVNAKDDAVAPLISFHPACKVSLILRNLKWNLLIEYVFQVGNVAVVLSKAEKTRPVESKEGLLLRKPSERSQFVNTHPSGDGPKLQPQASNSNKPTPRPASPPSTRPNARKN